jgi:hypothetical protein
MNMVTNSTATPKPSTFSNGTHRTGVMHQSEPPPEQPVSLPPITFDPLLTTKQVAVILNVSVETLKKWRQRRKNLIFLRLPSGAIRYRLSTVTTFLQACAFQS